MTRNLPADPRTSHRALSTRGGAAAQGRFTDFLPDHQALVEREAAPLARTLIFVVAALVGIFLLWAAFFQVEQVASAPAEIRPSGKVKVINHPTGGQVAALHISEGDRVKEGQILMEFDPDVARQEVAKRKDEWQSLSVQVSRLEAESSGKPLRFDQEIARERPDLIEIQRRLFASRQRSLGGQSGTATQVISQRRGELLQAEAKLRSARRSQATARQQVNKVRELVNKGYFPELRYLSMKRDLDETTGQVDEARERVFAAKAALAEAQSRQQSVGQDWRSDVLKELSQARADRDKAEAAYQQGRIMLRNLSMRAPISGYVKDLSVTGVGYSIRPSEEIMKIVPESPQLIVEAEVSNSDIGYIRPGQEATVKVRTYDFVRYGALKGVVEKVAPDATVEKATGRRYFVVTVRTRRSYLGNKPGQYPVRPGMQGDVDLLIGRRSILSYMTDRLQRGVESSFRER